MNLHLSRISHAIFTALLVAVLSGCMGGAGGGSSSIVGTSIDPPSSSVGGRADYDGVKLDVVIPVFDPGIPEDISDYEKKGIWPELRRTEAVHFALDLKKEIEATGVFGEVHVAPDPRVTGDIYLLGEIKDSNGEDVEIEVKAVDASGKEWMSKDYKHRVDEKFSQIARNRNKNSYGPIFEEVAEDVAKRVKKKDSEELRTLRAITELRFAQVFAGDALSGYLEKKKGKLTLWKEGTYTLVGLPARDDPMVERTRSIRVMEGHFLDRTQKTYENFAQRSQESYHSWQTESMGAAKKARELKRKGFFNKITGAAAAAAGIIIAVAGADYERPNPAKTDLGVVTTVAGILLLQKSFEQTAEGKRHAAVIDELGQSIELEMSPEVVQLENRTVELTGNAREQFRQWRDFLKEIYIEEKVPNKAL